MEFEGALVNFLKKYPWSNKSLLEAVFDRDILDVMFQNATENVPWPKELKTPGFRADVGQIQVWNIPGIGECYAWVKEQTYTALTVWRTHVVRSFVLSVMGPDAIRNGISPSPRADGEFLWDGMWWRVWADIGSVAPEALNMFRHPPETIGPNVRDVILTLNPDRIGSLAAQVNLRWPGTQNVFIWHYQTPNYRIVKHESYFGGQWHPYKLSELRAYIHDRIKDDRSQYRIGNLAGQLSPLDWQIMAEVGNHPLLSTWELAYLTTLRLVRFDFDHRHLLDKLAMVKQRVRFLMENHIFESPRLDQFRSCLLPSWRCLEMLSLYWGVDPEDMVRFQPWPQKKNDRDRVSYSKNWLSKYPTHQERCKQFCLSLLFGARSVANGLGWPEVDLITTIASRLVYRQQAITDDEKKIEWVTPDALVDMTIWESPGNNSKQGDVHPLIHRTLYVEIDRGTNRIDALDDRLDRYAKVWPYLRNKQPALLWVIMVDSAHRENEILQKMRVRRIEGWTVLARRLVLDQHDPYWTSVPPVFNEIEIFATGNMAPYRPIWSYTGARNREDLQLLGYAPWLAHNRIFLKQSNIYFDHVN